MTAPIYCLFLLMQAFLIHRISNTYSRSAEFKLFDTVLCKSLEPRLISLYYAIIIETCKHTVETQSK